MKKIYLNENIFGFIGVIVGCFLTYILNKISERNKIKNQIKTTEMTKLLEKLDDFSVKNCAYKYEFSKEIEEYLLKESKNIKDMEQLLTNWAVSLDELKDYSMQVMVNLRSLETKEIIFDKFLKYREKIYKIMYMIERKKEQLTDLYVNKYFYNGINKEYLKEIKYFENEINSNIKELDFHFTNMTIFLGNEIYKNQFKKKSKPILDKKFDVIYPKKQNLEFRGINIIQNVAMIIERNGKILIVKRKETREFKKKIQNEWEIPIIECESDEIDTIKVEKNIENKYNIIVKIGKNVVKKVFELNENIIEINFYQSKFIGEKDSSNVQFIHRWIEKKDFINYDFVPQINDIKKFIISNV